MEKATELNAAVVVPLLCERSNVRALDLEHWIMFGQCRGLEKVGMGDCRDGGVFHGRRRSNACGRILWKFEIHCPSLALMNILTGLHFAFLPCLKGRHYTACFTKTLQRRHRKH